MVTGTLRTFGAVWTTAWPFMSKMVLRPRSNIAIRLASRTPNRVFSSVTVSPIFSARTCASVTGVSRMWWVILKSIPPGVITALARRAEWHWMFTATGFIVMWVAATST